MNVTSPYGIIVNFFFLIWCRDWWYYIPCLDYCVTMSVIGTQRFLLFVWSVTRLRNPYRRVREDAKQI